MIPDGRGEWISYDASHLRIQLALKNLAGISTDSLNKGVICDMVSFVKETFRLLGESPVSGEDARITILRQAALTTLQKLNPHGN